MNLHSSFGFRISDFFRASDSCRAEAQRRRVGFRISLAVALLVAAGCAHYTPAPLHPQRTAAQFDERTLSDPGLRAYLEENLHRTLSDWPKVTWDKETLTLVAFYYHPSLDVARADWHVVAAGKETAAARPNPTVTGSILHEPAPDAPSPWIPAINFDLPIETAGKRGLRMNQVAHLSESARLNLITTAWQVRSRLHIALLDFSAAQQRLALLERQLALREELARRLESQLQAGAVSAVERDVARLTLVRARAELADARRLLAEARPRLADALGLPVSALADAGFRFDTASVGAANDLTTRQARDLALLGRADICAALADYCASQTALQLEIARQYPDVHLSPGYSWNGGSAGEHDWQLGATVELPLLNRNEGPIAEASARRAASAARFLALQAKVIGEIDTAVTSFRATQTNSAALDDLAAAQEKQQQAIAKQFQAGAADRLEVLAAELELNAVQAARLDAQVKLQQAVAALEDAVQRPVSAWPSFEPDPRVAQTNH